MIEFAKRPQVKRTDLGRFRSWKSLDGRYRIVEIFGAYTGHRWLAARVYLRGECPIGQGRKREDVIRACELHRKS